MDDTRTIPVPDLLPERSLSDVEPALLVLEVYRLVADSNQRAADAAAEAETRIQRHSLDMNGSLAALAVQRFEFERMLRRLRPLLEGCGDAVRVLDLFARGWDAVLGREQIEVRDLTGLPLSDEIAECIDEVSGAVPDHTADCVAVRETLVPVVLHRGIVIGRAAIVKTIPAANAAVEQKDAPTQEEESR